MEGLFGEIKARVGIAELVRFYGIRIDRNKAACPFHNEKTPSMMIYPDKNSFYCFGCGVGGSVIDFIARMFGVTPLEAAKKIDDDFRLGLADGSLAEAKRREYVVKRAERERDKRIYDDYESWESAYFNYLCEQLHLMEQLLEASRPMLESDMDAPCMDDYTLALNSIPVIEYQLGILTDGVLADKISLYKDKGGWRSFEQG
jgi:hypothetical protein